MKILFVNHNSDLYGASRSLLRMASRLVSEGHSVHVVLPEEGPLCPALAQAGVSCHTLPDLAIVDRAGMKNWRGRVGFIRRVMTSPFRLVILIGKIKPDIVHTNVSVILASGLAAKWTGLPHILHVREFYGEFKRAWPVYRRYLLWTSTRIVCVSKAVSEQFNASEKLMVLNNGFPTGEFQPVSTERVAEFRRNAGVDSRETLVGLPGRIKLKRKGQETFIEAAARLTERHPDARFLIIGQPFPGNEFHQAELEKLADNLRIRNQIIFYGECQDMQAAYAALDIVVLASGQPEPFGGVVIEAMAMSRPVVGTDIGGTPEQIEDQKTGFLVPPNDSVAMAGALDRLLGDPDLRRRMGEAARSRYEQKFEFESFFGKLMDLYTMLSQANHH